MCCELGQGWLYSQALDPNQIGPLVAAGQPLAGHPPRNTEPR
jgi:hypothetical protein